MKEHSFEYVKDSYLEGIQFTKGETTDVSLRHRLWFLKLQDATNQQIQESLKLQLKVLKERYPISNVIRLHTLRLKHQLNHYLVMHLISNLNIYDHKILLIRHTSHKHFHESVRSNYSSYLKSTSIR